MEWDPAKARGKLRKHTVSFADPLTALEDERAISVRDERADEGVGSQLIWIRWRELSSFIPGEETTGFD